MDFPARVAAWRKRADFITGVSSWDFRNSFSLGFANVPCIGQRSLEELLRIADEQMYQEKRTKRVRGAFVPAVKQTTVA